jgi:hypothetical protein
MARPPRFDSYSPEDHTLQNALIVALDESHEVASSRRSIDLECQEAEWED